MSCLAPTVVGSAFVVHCSAEHRYQESSLPPLQPPTAPTFPPDKSTVRRDNATFEWPEVDEAEE
jgi:hypothetical protein